MKLEKYTSSQLTKRLDKAFSLFIRYRDTDEDGYGNCATCGKRGHYKEMDAGHFISRRFHNVRWDESNVHLQCKYCNGPGNGEQFKMGQYILDKYGLNDLSGVYLAAKISGAPSRLEKIELIKKYEELNKNNCK